MAIKFLSGLNLSNVTAGSILKLDSNGNIVSAVDGTDYNTGSDAWSDVGSDIYRNSDVRIGTYQSSVAPSARLHVFDYQTTDPKLLIEDGNTGDASMQFKISTQQYTMGLDNSDSDKFKISAGSSFTTSDLIFTSDGKLGIGKSPLANFQVFKDTNGAVITKVTNDNTGTSAYAETHWESGTSGNELRVGVSHNYASEQWNNAWVYAINKDLALKAGSTGKSIKFYTNGSGESDVKAIISSSGNVGFGTTSPSEKVEIYGDATYYSAKNTSGNVIARLGADSSGDGNFELFQSADTNNRKVKFYAETGAANYINNGGNFGIGTNNPSAKLEVASNGNNGSSGLSDYGFVVTTSNGTDQPTLGAESTGDGYANLNLGSNISGTRRFWHISKRKSTDSHKLSFYYYDGSGFDEKFEFRTDGSFFADELDLPSGGQLDWANGDARIVEGLVSNYSLSFQTYTGSALTTKMFVSSGGNVGIGTSAPEEKLHVIGNIKQNDYIIGRGAEHKATTMPDYYKIAQVTIDGTYGTSHRIEGAVSYGGDNEKSTKIDFWVSFRSHGNLNVGTPYVRYGYKVENLNVASSNGFESGSVDTAFRVSKTSDTSGGDKVYEIQFSPNDSNYINAQWEVKYSDYGNQGSYPTTVYSTLQAVGTDISDSNISKSQDSTRVDNNTWITQLGVGSSNNTSFDFYNNGNSYFNGNVTVDANLSMTGGGYITTDSNNALVLRSDVQHDQGSTDAVISFKQSTTEHAKIDQDGYMYAAGFKTTTASTGFLKADGSVDTSSYLTSVAFSDITSKPTTLAGYGITDGATVGYVDTEVSGLASESYVTTQLASYTTTSSFGSNAFTSYTDHSTQGYLTSSSTDLDSRYYTETELNGFFKSITHQGNYISTANWSNDGSGSVASGWNAEGYPFSPTASFSRNGTDAENTRTVAELPNGAYGVVWRTPSNDSASDGDGGWDMDIYNVQHAKGYRSVVYFQKTDDSTSGTFYHGCHGSHTLNVNGTANSNPYFQTLGFSDLVENRWYVSVGYIQPYQYPSATDSTRSGIYDCYTGKKIKTGVDFMMKSGSTTQRHRTYQYYSTDPSSSINWWNPRFEEINGNEPSIAELIQRVGIDGELGLNFHSKFPAGALDSLTEATDATNDKILLWDESADVWKQMTLEDLQDSIDQNTTYSVATTSADGLMSSTDKTKLDGVATGADVTPSWIPASDPSYLTAVPSEYLTQNEGDARYVSFEKVDRSVPSTGGWYRLAKISRGAGRFSISYTGGNMSPHTYVIDAFKNWNNEATIAVEKFGHANYITSFRISRAEGAGNADYYLEGYFSSITNTHSFEARFQEILGYNNISEIFDVSSGSVLVASTAASGETIESLTTTTAEGLYLKNMNLDGRLNLYTDSNTTSTTALVLNGTEVEKRTLGSNAFTSTTYAPLASPALTGTPTAPTAGAGTNTTQIATTAFVSTAVSNLVDSAPEALDTLNELAAALGDDASFSTTVSTALGNRLRIDVSDQNLTATQKSNASTNLGLGTAATSAATDFVAVSGDTMTGSLTVEGDLTVGKDGTTPQVKLIYDDNHTNGDRWDTIIDIGRTQDRHSGDDQYPTYVTDNGYSISFQSNSDGVLFGMEEYSAGNYRPVIAWGDDNSDTPFNFRFNNSVKMSLAYNGVLTTAGNVVAGGNLKTTLNLDMRGQDVENATNVIYFNANNGNASNTSNDVGTGITWKPLYSGYTKRSAGIMQIGEGNYFKSGLAFYTNNTSDASTDWSERMRISKEGYVGIGISEPTKPLHVDGAIEAGGKITYLKSYGSLDTTGNAVAGLEESFNGASALFTFTCYGDTGGYQKIVYSCWNTSGTTWNVEKVIDEGTNDFDVTVDASGATRTFTFAARSGTKAYSPRVIVEASGSALDEQYL